MWLLESTGDFFQGRRMWLKPGKQYLFGRAKRDGVRFAIDHKTVSRKHFIIAVDDVKEDDVGNVYARTQVTITDQGSKSGTSVNGEKAKEPRILTQRENVIKLGTCAEELLIKWEPKVLTWNLLKKELKAGVLKTKQERVRELDLKVVSDYIPGATTHCIASKRNTAKGLQCLVDAKYLVAESYIDALEYAATPADLDEEENLSPLEQDFEKAWPDPTSHLPPPGKEPTSRPSKAYRPDPQRTNIFENFTFIFGDQSQFDNLLPPITTGHGKALFLTVTELETTPENVIKYMQNAAGKKGFGDVQRDVDKGAVILVRWTSKENQEWVTDLINRVSLKLDQRAIEQGEFLDAILANDASLLRQTVPFEGSTNGAVAAPVIRSQSDEQDSSRTKEERSRVMNGVQEQPAKVEALRATDAPLDIDNNTYSAATASQTSINPTANSQPIRHAFLIGPRKKNRLRDFDDGFDEDAVVPYQDDEQLSDESVPVKEADVTGDALVHRQDIDDHPMGHERSSRKRPYTSVEDAAPVNGGDDLDDLLPAATAMKRFKTANGRAVSKANTPEPSTKNNLLPRQKALKEVDVKQELRAKREATRKLEDDEEEQPIEYDEEGKLPIFEVRTEYVDVLARKKTVRENQAEDNPRWDPKWNGRKNFKAFRRARDSDGSIIPRRSTYSKIIVPLIDAHSATYGLGEEYWNTTAEDKARHQRISQRTSQNQHSSNRTNERYAEQSSDIADEGDGGSNNNPFDEDKDDGVSQPISHGATDRLPQSSGRSSRLQQEAAKIADHIIDINEPRQTRHGGDKNAIDLSTNKKRTHSRTNTQDTTDTSSPVLQHQHHHTSEDMSNNRTTRFGSSKRQKTIPVQTVHVPDEVDSDDSDDMKFKFGRGRRARARAGVNSTGLLD